VTEEAIFHRRFVDDVRSCAAGRAPASVAEIEQRIGAAMVAEPDDRERRWARVIAAVNELLAGIPARTVGPAARLRAFVRENADLDRPGDVAITDFRFVTRAETVLTDRSGRRYLVFAAIPRVEPPPPSPLDEVVARPTRIAAEWAVFGLCGSAAVAALWFAFIVPV
jgi:hypothetical protein